MCDVFAKLFIECMKTTIKDDKDKCKKEFENWDSCYKNTYFKEFIIVLKDNDEKRSIQPVNKLS